MPSLNFIMIRASNIEASLDFYKNLGFDFREHQHGDGPVHYCADSKDLAFEIYPAVLGIDTKNVVRLGFQVLNLEDEYKRLKKLNANFLVEPTKAKWGYRAVIIDPDDNRVELVQNSDIDF